MTSCYQVYIGKKKDNINNSKIGGNVWDVHEEFNLIALGKFESNYEFDISQFENEDNLLEYYKEDEFNNYMEDEEFNQEEFLQYKEDLLENQLKIYIAHVSETDTRDKGFKNLEDERTGEYYSHYKDKIIYIDSISTQTYTNAKNFNDIENDLYDYNFPDNDSDDDFSWDNENYEEYSILIGYPINNRFIVYDTYQHGDTINIAEFLDENSERSKKFIKIINLYYNHFQFDNLFQLDLKIIIAN